MIGGVSDCRNGQTEEARIPDSTRVPEAGTLPKKLGTRTLLKFFKGRI
jgi:hypothetical protein